LFAVGQQGVHLAKAVEQLGELARAKLSEIHIKETEIKALSLGATSPADFVSLTLDTDVAEKLQQAESNVQSIKQSASIKGRQFFAKIDLPDTDAYLSSLLTKQLNDVSQEAEAKTKAQIKQLSNHGETWIRDGIELISDARCPFCGQDMSTSELLNAYRGYFNSAYTELKQEVVAALSQLEQRLSARRLEQLCNTIDSNNHLAQIWCNEVNVGDLSFDVHDLRQVWECYLSVAKECLERKKAAPLEQIAPSSASLLQAEEKLTAIRTNVSTYNDHIDAINVECHAFISNLAVADLKSAISEVDRLKLIKLRSEAYAIKLCNEYAQLQSEKQGIDTQKTQAKSALDSFTTSFFETYSSRVNELLANFGTSFTITKVKTSYTGGPASFVYKLFINGTEVDVEESKLGGKPSFRTVLSDGDKSALAFAVFVAKLEYDPSLAGKVIVIDDPITSLDTHRKTCTQQEICRIAQKALQVIVLSHDPAFLKGVRDKARAKRKNAKELVI
jgi:wobble nucleotide-excising tRNase